MKICHQLTTLKDPSIRCHSLKMRQVYRTSIHILNKSRNSEMKMILRTQNIARSYSNNIMIFCWMRTLKKVKKDMFWKILIIRYSKTARKVSLKLQRKEDKRHFNMQFQFSIEINQSHLKAGISTLRKMRKQQMNQKRKRLKRNNLSSFSKLQAIILCITEARLLNKSKEIQKRLRKWDS